MCVRKDPRKLKQSTHRVLLLTFHGLPGSNSGTRSLNASFPPGQSLLSCTLESGQPESAKLLRPLDHGLVLERYELDQNIHTLVLGHLELKELFACLPACITYHQCPTNRTDPRTWTWHLELAQSRLNPKHLYRAHRVLSGWLPPVASTG